MKYVLGIDSGGTKYLVRACALDGEPLAVYTGLPAGHYRVEHAEVLRRVNESIDKCLACFDGLREDCACVVCGSTGLDSPQDQRVVDEIYGSLPGFVCPVICVNDAQVAQFAVTGGVGDRRDRFHCLRPQRKRRDGPLRRLASLHFWR